MDLAGVIVGGDHVSGRRLADDRPDAVGVETGA